MSNQQIKILHVTQVTIFGVGRHILSLLKHGHRDGIYQEVACPVDENFTSIVESSGVKTQRVPMTRSLSPVSAFMAGRRLYRLMRQESYDVVHFHSSIAGAVGRPVARACKVPAVVYTPHGFSFLDASTSPTRLLLYTTVERVLARFCDAVVVVSQGEMDAALRVPIAPRKKLALIRNGIECEDFIRCDPKAIRRELGLADDVPIVGMTGRLDPQKGITTFLHAAAIIGSRMPTVTFVLVGDEHASPGYARYARELAKQLGIGERTIFTGYRPDAIRIASCFNVAVSASDWEGLSYSVLEYMGLGIPTVATEVNGVCEVVNDGENGFVVPPGDARLLAERVILLLRDSQLCRRFSVQSAASVRRAFAASTMADRTFALYRELLTQSRQQIRQRRSPSYQIDADTMHGTRLSRGGPSTK